MRHLFHITWLVCGSLILMASAGQARQVLRIGGEGQISWAGQVLDAEGIETIEPEHRSILNPNLTEIGTSPADLVEFASADFPGSILPRQVGEGENLATGIYARGGGMSAPTVVNLGRAQLEEVLAQVAAEKSTGKAFMRQQNDALGTLLVMDLGARFGVNQIRFFPRNTVFPAPMTPFQSNFLKNFEVHVNDGLVLTEGGNPIWEIFEIRNNNTKAVTTVDIEPPRYIRFVRLKATSSIPFEIEKLQIFGEGFLPTVRYISPIIDMGTPANWGQLRWAQELVGQADKAQMQIRTRSGGDPSPLSYTRKQVGLRNAEPIPFSVEDPSQPLLRDEFLDLPLRGGQTDAWERGPVRDDWANWSPWSPPYGIEEGTSEAGTPILSPSPRRYFQFRVDFLSDDLGSAFALKDLSFDYTSPPLADRLVGEVFPRQVPAATDISFVFALKVEMENAGLQGFDSVEIATVQRVDRIERIEIIDGDGEKRLDHAFAVQDDVTEEGEVAITRLTDAGFAVRFPRIAEDNTVLKIHFVTRVLSYSTSFAGRAMLLAEDEFQGVIAGDAAQLADADQATRSGVTVLSPAVNQGSLIGSFSLDRNVLTPNGDGANDYLALSCEVLAVVGTARVRVDIFDLAGRRVRHLFEFDGESGVYDAVRFSKLVWDGKDGVGELVRPGIYLVRLEVGGDARQSASARPVGVIY